MPLSILVLFGVARLPAISRDVGARVVISAGATTLHGIGSRVSQEIGPVCASLRDVWRIEPLAEIYWSVTPGVL